LLALGAPVALAVPEIGDAGDLPLIAQEPGPAGTLTSIEGASSSTGDRDMYKVCLRGGGTFSATTVDRAGFDTQLFLFDSQGLGVYANDDALGSLQSLLPAGHLLTPQAAGVYYLAVTPFNWDPHSDTGPIFPTGNVVGPTDTYGALPISGWSADDQLEGNAYTIALEGTRSCVDTTPPTVDLRTPADGAEYARGDVVLADYDCADEADGSGLASCSASVADGAAIDTGTLGAHDLAVTAEDWHGNHTTVTHSYTVVDRDAPNVDLGTPADGAEYPRDDVVLADYVCADEAGGSGLASCTGPVAAGAAIDTAALGPHTFAVTAVDAAGNRTTETHSYRVLDVTPPTVDVRAPHDGAQYTRGQQVLADYRCADEPGTSLSCVGSVADGAAIDTSDLGRHEFSVTAVDAAGNSTTVIHLYTVLDGTVPTIDLRAPRDGARYELGQVVAADYDCVEEPGSPPPTCVGDVPVGGPVDTATLGEHTFSVYSRDAAGNAGTRTATYTVEEPFRFDFEGFFRPVANRPKVNVVKAGWIVPIRFRLDGFHGRDVIANGHPRSREYPCGSSANLDRGAATRPTGRHRLRYKPRRDLYIYRWKTDRDWAGDCRQFILKLSDGSYHRADFRFIAKPRHKHDHERN
jgi:hypothetical protein